MERVVITGMGAITPVGNDVQTFWESLKAGKCGIGPITKFDVSDYKVKLAAEVKDFDVTQYVDKREARSRRSIRPASRRAISTPTARA